MKKILVSCFGVLGRSLSITYQNHVNKVFSVLDESEFEYDMCYINNDVEDDLIDGKHQDTSYLKEINYDFFNEVKQSQIDSEIKNLYPNYASHRKRGSEKGQGFFRRRYFKKFGLNPFRNSFIETYVSEFLKNQISQYDYVYTFCSDLWFDKKIDLGWILKHPDSIIVGDSNPAMGITNGFYAGKLNNVANLLNSFYDLNHLAQNDYECILKLNKIKHNLQVVEHDFRFIKIRSNGEPANYANVAQLQNLHNRTKHIISDFNKCQQKNSEK